MAKSSDTFLNKLLYFLAEIDKKKHSKKSKKKPKKS